MEKGLQQALTERKAQRIQDTGRLLSAVLLPIYWKEGEYYLLFTRRTQHVRDHKGQISFPGGVYKTEDGSLLNTALRESAEEIGLEPDVVKVLGQLDDFITQTSNYIISPFVGAVPYPYEFRVNPLEIEEIIEIPVSALLDDEAFHEEAVVVDGDEVAYGSYHYLGNVIWGATAKILNQFLGIIAPIM